MEIKVAELEQENKDLCNAGYKLNDTQKNTEETE